MEFAGRSPRGECGLKYQIADFVSRPIWSLPSRGVWIEIEMLRMRRPFRGSLPSRGVWIEIEMLRMRRPFRGSLPSRGVWIEIGQLYWKIFKLLRRSPRGECGLKYYNHPPQALLARVAPLAGSVD